MRAHATSGRTLDRSRKRVLTFVAVAACALGGGGSAQAADDLSAALAAQVASATELPTVDAALVDTQALDEALADVAAASEDVGLSTTPQGAPATEAPPQGTSAAQYSPQYHAEEPQYQAPEATAASAAAPAEPAPEPTAAPSTPAAAQQPVNINISVRVLSPGNDGPVSQSGAPAPDQPIARAIDGAETSIGTAASINVTVNVNVTFNWNLTWNPITDQTQYHSSASQYHNPESIQQWISRTIESETDRWNDRHTSRDTPLAEGARPSPQQPSTNGYRSDGRAFDRTWRGRTEAAPAGRAPLRRTSAAPSQLSAATPATLWPAGRPAAATRAPRDEPGHGTESRKRAAGEPSRPNDASPERLAGSSASTSASPLGPFFKMFAILVASLGLAGLSSARRLRLPSAFRRRPWSSRPERPG